MKNLTILLIVCSFIYSCSKTQNSHGLYSNYDSLNYDIYFADRLAGKQISWKEGSDFRFIYEFNDRGRGPYFDETINIDENGLIIRQVIDGHNYLKDTVHEEFYINDGLAKWESAAESGTAEFNGNSYYLAISGSLGSMELLVNTLRNKEGNDLQLLPGGKVTLVTEKIFEIGNSQPLKLMTLTGINFTPFYLWIDDNGRMVGLLGSWFKLIRTDFDSLRNDLYKIQEEADDQYFRNVASTVSHTPESGIVINNVNLFDSETGKIHNDMTVEITGNSISRVGKSNEIEIKEGVEVIDGSGKMLLPGLFDMHGHFSKIDGILDLAAGVTSARDLANDLDLPSLRDKFSSNEFAGPRIVVMAGFIDGSGPFAGPTGKIISNIDEGKRAIQEYADLGYQQIKLYSSIKPEWVEPLTAMAKELGLKVSGHIPAFMTAEQAVENGYNEIQHANMLILNFLPDTIDTRTPLRFTTVAEHAHTVNVSSDRFQKFADLLKAKNIVIDPTVSIFEGMFKGRVGEPNPAFSMILDRLPIQVRRGFYTGGLPVPPGQEENYNVAHDRMLQIVKALYDYGITVVPGTDALAGFALHRELELYNKAGISTTEVIQIATIGSARVAGVDDILGSIAEGKLADMILIDGNPVTNISDVRRVELTIKDGIKYDPAKLYQAIGVKHFK